MQMTGYTKLFGSIVASTIWREPHETRIVWITMLALANKNGVVEASIPGLADLARVTIPECEEALKALAAPDTYSRTKDFDGRRIEAVDGGWAVLNHAKYRAKMGVDERRQYLTTKQRERRARVKVNTASTEVNKCNGGSTESTQAEAEAQPNAEAESNSPTPRRKRRVRALLECPAFKEFWQAYPRREAKANAEEAWLANNCASLLPQILVAVRAAKISSQWTREGGRWIPHPATWLNRRGWEDEASVHRSGGLTENFDHIRIDEP